LLTPEAVAGMKLAQAKSMSPAQLGALTKEQVAKMSASVLNGLSAAQKAAIAKP
jgi:hypothetical protein